MPTDQIIRKCPLCNTDNRTNSRSHWSKDQWTIKECSKCGFVYLENVPNYSQLEENFAWDKTFAATTQSRTRLEPNLKKLSSTYKKLRIKYFPRKKLDKLVTKFFSRGKILDIGCGGASWLGRLDSSFVPFGIEISKTLAKLASDVVVPKGGSIVQQNAVDGCGQFPPGFFSGVVMMSFLEHESNPRLLLQNVRRVMSPGGHCVLKVPNFSSLNRILRKDKWCGFRFPDHVNYFTPDHLADLVRSEGFSIEQFSLLDRFPTSDNMWLVIRA